jgi:hypothetical protein
MMATNVTARDQTWTQWGRRFMWTCPSGSRSTETTSWHTPMQWWRRWWQIELGDRINLAVDMPISSSILQQLGRRGLQDHLSSTPHGEVLVDRWTAYKDGGRWAVVVDQRGDSWCHGAGPSWRRSSHDKFERGAEDGGGRSAAVQR